MSETFCPNEFYRDVLNNCREVIVFQNLEIIDTIQKQIDQELNSIDSESQDVPFSGEVRIILALYYIYYIILPIDMRKNFFQIHKLITKENSELIRVILSQKDNEYTSYVESLEEDSTEKKLLILEKKLLLSYVSGSINENIDTTEIAQIINNFYFNGFDKISDNTLKIICIYIGNFSVNLSLYVQDKLYSILYDLIIRLFADFEISSTDDLLNSNYIENQSLSCLEPDEEKFNFVD